MILIIIKKKGWCPTGAQGSALNVTLIEFAYSLTDSLADSQSEGQSVWTVSRTVSGSLGQSV